MTLLVPAPAQLHLASPALGPWFHHASDTPPTLPLPGGDLAISLTLTPDMEWRTPAIALRTTAIATPVRPAVLAGLRAESGAPAFADGALVILLTLLPEVAARLAALARVLPAPDGTMPAEDARLRPMVTHFALEVPASRIAGGLASIERLREVDLPASLTTPDARAAYLGLVHGANLGNAARPATELRRPETSSAVALANRSGSPLAVKLWCFDELGRPLDPGAIACAWAEMASSANWENLWAAENNDAGRQRTAAVTAGRLVALVNAHQGPLAAEVIARLAPTDLTQVSGSTALYTAGAAPALALSAASNANSDLLPLPRLVPLPAGTAATPATAAPFAGWTGTDWPAGLTRDFTRLALLDIESHLTGLSRATAAQADPARRLGVARNTAATPFLPTIETVNAAALDMLAAGDAIFMVPTLDRLWGESVPAALPAEVPPASISISARALAGEGTATGGTVAGQSVLLDIPGLPAGAWVRVWPHIIEASTGRRARATGGAAIADTAGNALLVLPLPDGQADATLTADALIVTAAGARLVVNIGFERPALAAGSRTGITASATAFFNTSRGEAFNPGTGSYRSGDVIIANPAAAQPSLLDNATLRPQDMVPRTLPNALAASDTLVLTQPAFAQTSEGGITAGPLPGGATLVRRTRNALSRVEAWAQPVPSQERREVAGREANATGVIAAAPALASLREAPPPQLGNAGLPAGPEIHGCGLALAGPAADLLRAPLTARAADGIIGFLRAAGRPFTATPDPGGSGFWSAVLETTTHGMHGNALIRALIARFGSGFTPGASWQSWKTRLETEATALGLNLDLDNQIDSANFDDDLAAAALDALVLKTRDGAQQFASAARAAIARAEDLVFLETPALDALTTDFGLVGALVARLAERPALHILLNVPERFLPGQPARLEAIRRAGLKAARAALEAAAPGRIGVISPNAGTGRPLHLASTTLIIDDALLLTGSAHGWRRGLSFDSALSAALFDERFEAGRPAAVRTARRTLLANALGLDPGQLPEAAAALVAACNRLNALGGRGRVTANAWPAAADETSDADLAIWNPDGRPGITSDWYIFLAALGSAGTTDPNNAVR